MPQSDKPRVSLVVEPELKYWMEEHYPPEGRDYDSLANLVRTAIRRELDGHHDEATTSPETGSLDAIEELSESVARIEDTVQDTQERVRRLEAESKTEGLEYDLKKLAFGLVPVAESKDPLEIKQTAVTTGELLDEAQSLGLDVDRAKFQTALSELADQNPLVHYGGPVADSGEPGYYKENER